MSNRYEAMESDADLDAESTDRRSILSALKRSRSADDPPREKRSLLRWIRREKKPDPVAEEGDSHRPDDEIKRRISLLQPQSVVAEQFRTLRGRIDSLSAQHSVRSIAVTSASPGEGKTTSSVNLAIVSAMSVDTRVLLMDCDLRRPAVHTALGLEPKAGIGEVLRGEATFDEAIIPLDGTDLHVMGVREMPGNPSELLASSRMVDLIAEAASRYDRVIVDTPVTMGLSDARTVAALCDGVVFVVRAGVTELADIETCIDLLDRRRVMGLVLNDAEMDAKSYGYY